MARLVDEADEVAVGNALEAFLSPWGQIDLPTSYPVLREQVYSCDSHHRDGAASRSHPAG